MSGLAVCSPWFEVSVASRPHKATQNNIHEPFKQWWRRFTLQASLVCTVKNDYTLILEMGSASEKK